MEPISPDEIALCDLGMSDYPEILALWQRAGLPVRPAGRDAPEAVAQQLARGSQLLLGLRAGRDLVAVVLLTHDGRKGWINRLAVDAAYRRRGLAVRLLAEAERWFADVLGLEVWSALVEDGNRESLALFDHAGYRVHDMAYVSKRVRPES